jgi:hypothetical protein
MLFVLHFILVIYLSIYFSYFMDQLLYDLIVILQSINLSFTLLLYSIITNHWLQGHKLVTFQKMSALKLGVGQVVGVVLSLNYQH